MHQADGQPLHQYRFLAAVLLKGQHGGILPDQPPLQLQTAGEHQHNGLLPANPLLRQPHAGQAQVEGAGAGCGGIVHGVTAG